MTQIFYGKSHKGNILWANNRALSEYLSSVEGKPLIIKIDREKIKRTLDQNSYYWFYLRIISNETGHTEWELHQLFKRIFLPPKIIKVLGREIKTPASTQELAKYEFSEYLDKISAEVNIPLPDPKDVQNIVQLEYPSESLTPTF